MALIYALFFFLISAARELIDKYNYERNPTLKLLVHAPAAELVSLSHSLHHTLIDVMPYQIPSSVEQLLAPSDTTEFSADGASLFDLDKGDVNMRIEHLVFT